MWKFQLALNLSIFCFPPFVFRHFGINIPTAFSLLRVVKQKKESKTMYSSKTLNVSWLLWLGYGNTLIECIRNSPKMYTVIDFRKFIHQYKWCTRRHVNSMWASLFLWDILLATSLQKSSKDNKICLWLSWKFIEFLWFALFTTLYEDRKS